nr:MAG TPA: hypothetical protein [Caudoviricetes sp.]DAV07948.1 MAG TPA: hypothetical protein [Caudoviricetes sp.]
MEYGIMINFTLSILLVLVIGIVWTIICKLP